jgi:beta-N-acetylhexosaminidase
VCNQSEGAAEALEGVIAGLTQAQVTGAWQPREASEVRRLALLPQTPPVAWDDLMVQAAYMHAQDQLP